MTDYIRGKKAYTKWDVDADNVDMDIPPNGQQPRVQIASPGWFSGKKGKVLKALFFIFLFLIGLILGYLVRRGVHEIVLDRQKEPCSFTSGVYAYRDKYSNLLKKLIDADSIQNILRNISSEVHRAGTEGARRIAQQISNQWKEYGLFAVRIEKYNILLSLPPRDTPNKIQIIDKDGELLFSASEFGDGALYPEIRPYCAYSPKGTAKGKLIYAHYGTKDDFEILKSKVSVKGAVVIMRNGKLHRGNKIKLAQELGAVAAILYPDPIDSVRTQSHIFPLGLGLPGDGVVRGNIKTVWGDPQTPLLPSTDDIYRLPISDLDLPEIPVQPIGYNDAQVLLNGLGGPQVPSGWKGGLNITYHLGPGYNHPNDSHLVSVIVANELQPKDVFNVLATIPGEFEPGRYVIIGAHHDSWTNGSSDPGTGTAILMELARVFGLLYKQGWRPGRTIVFASWDAEEFGISGSTEWVEEHAKELIHGAVAYINLDAAVTGNHTLQVLGSPLLRQALYEATKEVPCHESGHSDMTVYDMWKLRRPQQVNQPTSEPELLPPGSGSDFVSFMTSVGVSSAHLQFVSKDLVSDYPLYHTAYDVFDAVANFTDPHFSSSKTMASILGVLVLKLSDSPNLPFHTQDYSTQVKIDFAEFTRSYKSVLSKQNISLEPVEKAVDLFGNACFNFHDNFEKAGKHNLLLALREYNDHLLELERAFLLPGGATTSLPYRHAIYGPHHKNSYKGTLFPHLQADIEDAQKTNQWKKVQLQLSYVLHALRSAVGVLESHIFAGVRGEL